MSKFFTISIFFLWGIHSSAEASLNWALDSCFKYHDVNWNFVKSSFDNQLVDWGITFEKDDSAFAYHTFFSEFETYYKPIRKTDLTDSLFNQLARLGGFQLMKDRDPVNMKFLNIWWLDIHRNFKSEIRLNKIPNSDLSSIQALMMRSIEGRIHLVDIARLISFTRPNSVFNTKEYQKIFIGIFYPLILNLLEIENEEKVIIDISKQLKPIFKKIDWKNFEEEWMALIDTTLTISEKDSLDNGQKIRRMLSEANDGFILPKSALLEKTLRSDSLVGDYRTYLKKLNGIISSILAVHERNLSQLHPLKNLSSVLSGMQKFDKSLTRQFC
ncbi:MAG: hypothetical protein IPO32_09620 [Crocinitomicaceae bacterium]|nr:hypothetical protein [Crocinitomicaceae bacterium]